MSTIVRRRCRGDTAKIDVNLLCGDARAGERVAMQVIGLTGGIASGKSTVGRMLRAKGVHVIDADDLARDAVSPGSEGLRAIVERFGQEMCDDTGALRRERLGQVVFADPAARAALNEIVHPVVKDLAAKRLVELGAAGVTHAVYEVPLLFENHLEGS
ncbi:MAG: dephospho-CoA kinase, partial [Myxococcota bacterium]